MARVERIFIASSRGSPMQAVETVEAIAGQGLQGDRYATAKNRHPEDCQITLIELENIDAFSKDTGLSLTADMPRRNIVTSGSRLNEQVGKQFTVGTAILEGMELCEPCNLFSKRTYREALRYFIGKGGLRARIVAGGTIRVEDPIVVQT